MDSNGQGTVSKPKRRYTDEDRATALAALAANAGNVVLTARQLGIPVRTLRSWDIAERHPEAADMCLEKRKPLSDRFEDIAHKLLDHAEGKETIKKASAKDAVTGAAISVDKMRLLREQPTVIAAAAVTIDVTRLTDEQLTQLETILTVSGHTPADRNGTLSAQP